MNPIYCDRKKKDVNFRKLEEYNYLRDDPRRPNPNMENA